MSIPTIAQTIVRGDISTYLAANYNAKGSLFGGRKAPVSAVTIAIVADALRWGSDGGAQTSESLRSTANYLIWLTNMWGQEAQSISSGAGGGTVIPGGGSGGSSTIYPFIITSGDFQPDGISYNNPDIVGDNLSLFINEYSQQWLVASGTTFTYTATGFQILIPDFDANTQEWTIMVQKLNS